MTRQEWNTIQEKYESRVFGTITIKVGIFEVTLQKQIGKKKIFNVVFVNDELYHKWYLDKEYDGPEKQFMYKTTRVIRIFTDKEIRRIKRECGSSFAKNFQPVKIDVLKPFYPSFTAFKKQMIATGLTISFIN